MSETDREAMVEHLNQAVENLGDTMFGDDSSAEDLKTFVDGLEEEESKAFVKAVTEALLLEDEWVAVSLM